MDPGLKSTPGKAEPKIYEDRIIDFYKDKIGANNAKDFAETLKGQLGVWKEDLFSAAVSSNFQEIMAGSPKKSGEALGKALKLAGGHSVWLLKLMQDAQQGKAVCRCIIEKPDEMAMIAKLAGGYSQEIDFGDPLLFRLYCDILNSTEIDMAAKGAIFGSNAIRRAAHGEENAFLDGTSILQSQKMKVMGLLSLYGQEKENYKEYTLRFGVRPARVAGFFDGKKGKGDDDVSLTFEKRAIDAIKKAADQLGLGREFLAASLMQEGLVNVLNFVDMYLVDRYSGSEKTFVIDSFHAMGMESFPGLFESLKKKGYLRGDFSENKDYRLDKASLHNEVNTLNRQAYFKNIETAIEAFGAMMKHYQDQFYGVVGGRQLTKEQRMAGTYFFYNTGGITKKCWETAGEPAMDGNGKKGDSGREANLKRYLEKIINAVDGKPRYGSKNDYGARGPAIFASKAPPDYNYARVLATVALLENSGVFKENETVSKSKIRTVR